jgi:hypothetical protein
VRYIEALQTAWAQAVRRDTVRPEYVSSVSDNLILRCLDKDTASEFRAADGSELRDSPKRPAKMRALMSSSALAVNFFDAWRRANKAPLGSVLALGTPCSELRFEYVCKGYPVGPRSPNLDLLLTLADGRRVGVESKFAEPYRRAGRHAQLAAKYLEAGKRHWAEAGLNRAQSAAEKLRAAWKYLDVAQLLKHMLGLAKDGCGSTILYLWYDTGLDDAGTHRAEIEKFAEAIRGDSVEFRARTYQQAFRALEPASTPAVGWYEYMATRYFGGSEGSLSGA